MEKLDLLILSELEKDARASFSKIAKKLGISPYTIRKSYERMKQEGKIYRSTVCIDLSKLGYQGKALLLITVSPQQTKTETILALRRIRNVITVTEIIGSFDLLAIAPITDFASIKMLVDEAKRAPNVERVDIACINDTSFPAYPSFREMFSKRSRDLARS